MDLIVSKLKETTSTGKIKVELRIILDHDELAPESIVEIRAMLTSAAQALPNVVHHIEAIRLRPPTPPKEGK